MKKAKLFLGAALAAVLCLWTGCREEEQSEFNLDSLNERATVEGFVYYSTGVDTLGTDYSINIKKPAMGRKVFVEIGYDQFSAAANPNDGSKIYEAVTDTAGYFSLQVPTKSAGINATLRLEEFTAYYTEYLKMEAGKPVFKTNLRRYGKDQVIELSGLKPGTKSFQGADAIYYESAEVDLDGFNEKVTLTGNILLAVETGYRQGTFQNANAATVEFTINYGTDVNASTAGEVEEFTFGTQTDESGNYSITIPAQSLRDGFTVKNIAVQGVGNSAFKHWTSPTESGNISGAYAIEDIYAGSGRKVENIIADMPYELGSTHLFFTPSYNGDLTQTPNPINWRGDLAGWAFGMADFKDMAGKVTLTGSVKLATESTYGIGTYSSAVQAINITYPGYTTLATATDADGNFSVEVPVADPNVKVNFDIELDNSLAVSYTHYTKTGTKVLKDGEYETNGTQIINREAEWTDLGTYYHRFEPAMANTPETWNENLAGWVKIQDYDLTATVTGKAMLAYETAFAVGSYQGAQNEIVSISVTYPDGTRQFAAPVKEDGTFSIVIPKKEESDQYDIEWGNKTYETTEFKHFTKAGTTESKLIKGEYYSYNAVTDRNKKELDWNNIGTRYYRFTPENANDVKEWNENLAGWVKMVDADGELYGFSATVTGKVMFACETAYGVGSYEGANNEIITISVTYPNSNAVSFAALTKEDGTFSITIPKEEENDQYTSITGTITGETKEFKHFTKYGTSDSEMLQGSYGYYVADRNSELEWNDFGTQYFKFSPSTTAKNWHDNLAGWVKIENTNGSLYDKTVTVSGKAMFAKETAFAVGEYVAAAGEVIAVEATDPSSGYSYTYEAVVGTDGKFTVAIPVKHEIDEPVAYASADAIEADDFVHFVNKNGIIKQQILEGTYTTNGATKDITAAWNELGTFYYTFSPASDSGDQDWHANLAGWVRSDYTAKGTITGTLLFPRETGFWTGDYVAKAYQVVTLNCNGFTLQGATDADGNFSIDVPLQYADDQPTVTWNSTSFSTDALGLFTHYRNPAGTTQQLEGRYSTLSTIRTSDAEWNERGTRYLEFTPSTSTINWSNNLPGWKVYSANATQSYTITGTVKKAVESWNSNMNLAEADWATAGNCLMTITISSNTFDVVTNSTGTFAFQMKAEELPNKVTANIALKESSAEFIHYADPAVNETSIISGYYYSPNDITINKPSSGSLYRIDPSAKLLFEPNNYYTPGWNNYDWDAIMDQN